ncbi:MAG: glycerophosphodiester phosphodiesterase [Desulfobacteraceae bacterium]|jgi:glycerophosphoryl diester phosphodiesterase|nr:glycerophosphodiester phosphodiesterase [Desulfobacteraceae bacterium]
MKLLPMRIRTLLVLLLIILIAYAILRLLAKPIPDHPYFIPDKFLVIAHRGGPSLGPESTLYTFRKAVKLGVDVLEMDVRSTRDGQLIILHDDTVSRTTNATGPAQNYTLVDLKKLDAAHRWSPDNGQTFPLRNKGVQIPTLSEVFEAFPQTKLNLEIKEARSSTIPSLCRLIRDHQMTSNVVVASFDTDSLKEFRRLCPQVATSAGASEARLFFGLQKAYLEAAYSPDAQVLQVPEALGDLRIVDKRFIDAAHARNMRVQVWLVNDVRSMQRLLELGVDGIMTDYPQRLMEVLKKH